MDYRKKNSLFDVKKGGVAKKNNNDNKDINKDTNKEINKEDTIKETTTQ